MDILGKSHYDLYEIQQLLHDPDTRIITRSSFTEAVKLGYASESDMVKRVQKLKKTEIYKTMTSHKNSSLWQDVYITTDKSKSLYIKLQKSLDGKGIIISFKEKI